MLRLFAFLCVSLACLPSYGQTFGLGTNRTSVVSEQTFGLSSSAKSAAPVKALPESLPRPLVQESKSQVITVTTPQVEYSSTWTPVARPVAAAPMVCENGVCRPVSQPVFTRPRLFRRR